MSDLIRREDAMQAIADYEFPWCKDSEPVHLVYGMGTAMKIVEKIPAVDAVEVSTIQAWLYEIAGNNINTEKERQFSEFCEELISRLDGLRNFAREKEL